MGTVGKRFCRPWRCVRQLRRIANPVLINARYRPVIWLLYVVAGDLTQVALHAYVARNLSVTVYVVRAVV